MKKIIYFTMLIIFSSFIFASNYPWAEITNIGFNYNINPNSDSSYNLTLNVTTDTIAKIYVEYGTWGNMGSNTISQIEPGWVTNHTHIIQYVDQSQPLYFDFVIYNLNGCVKTAVSDVGYYREEFAWCSNSQTLTDYTKTTTVDSRSGDWVDYFGFPYSRPLRQPRPSAPLIPKYNISYTTIDQGNSPVCNRYPDISGDWQVDLVSSFGCTSESSSNFWFQNSILGIISNHIITSTPPPTVDGYCNRFGCFPEECDVSSISFTYLGENIDTGEITYGISWITNIPKPSYFNWSVNGGPYNNLIDLTPTITHGGDAYFIFNVLAGDVVTYQVGSPGCYSPWSVFNVPF